ncbi:DNA polymerase III subunit gamma/tau [Vibrio ziniensis]|uniref:DNA polymerase III subunit gamma/tau n=1 Tax=Vibrio ziniensis TaxID=2711221 RepID=A0A6G7CJV2_9VIBR|nr:DNA polymerase III subunit gamma/tau [Vibrio ziniensis]QIH42326.1 DNA polymerase III subunit gamma/tau [Vibrio ziniensis]
MSYLALARKWRPTKFKEVVGQAHVLTALENALAHNQLHHAYLFSGTRGVGKTTIGRLFAKGLNCETGITSTPCGECSTCKEIDQGRFVDLLEIDAASRTKVEDTRELLDNVQYKPARGRFKVYLIDEVHMLSRHSFNALLKTLEEPPEYVKFLLATTDPQKLPMTILSRCLQFHLKPISIENIQQQLEHVLSEEKIAFENKALGLIAHAADGSMRDALSLTDQAIALGNNHVNHNIVSHMLGTLDTDQALHLLQSISSKQPQKVMESIEVFAQNGVEWDGLLQQFATQLHRVAMFQALPASLDKSAPDAEKIQWLAQSLTPQDVQLYYQIALKGRADLAASPTGRIGMEMIALRMMAFRPSQVSLTSAISTQYSSVEQAPVTPQLNTAPMTMAVPSVQQPTVDSVQPSQTATSAGVPEQYSAPQYLQESVHQPVVHQQSTHPTSEPASQAQAVQANPAMQPAMTETPAQDRKAASPLTGLRHQLRSQREGLNQQGNSVQGNSGQQGSSPKKSEAASAKPTSVLERVAQRAQNASPMSPSFDTNEPEEQEAYQWRPTQPVADVEVKKELTPTQIKKSLEHEKTPEMTSKLIDEACALSEWANLIQSLETAKLVEQLALNSVYKKQGNVVELLLRSSHAHLNTDKAQSELLQAINTKLGEECVLSVSLGEDGETPLELRERLYQEKLSHAMSQLSSDPNVQFIERRFSAELDKDSVRPI